MRRFSIKEARSRMTEVLDLAERGEIVVIEREGVRFQIIAENAKVARKRSPILEILDPAIERGTWTWAEGTRGLQFIATKPL
jgi:antitoxin (DNA-binding transcriptional repressor) of toxin-antitoxin stability system